MAKPLKFDRLMTPDNPITAQELRSGELILARLIAAAYAADHPESFAKGWGTIPKEKPSSQGLQAGEAYLTARPSKILSGQVGTTS